MHGDLMPKQALAVHNATTADRYRAHEPPEVPVLRYLGSLRAMKGLLSLLEQTGPLSIPLEIIGATEQEREQAPAGIRVLPSVPYTSVPNLISTASAVLLPLKNNFFGQRLSSPLKLWDYLASGTPIVAASVGSVHEVLNMTSAHAHTYSPEDPASVHIALDQALAAAPRERILRTWADRASEISPILRSTT